MHTFTKRPMMQFNNSRVNIEYLGWRHHHVLHVTHPVCVRDHNMSCASVSSPFTPSLRITFSSIRPSRPPVGIGKTCSGPFSMRPRPPPPSRPHPYMHAHDNHSQLPRTSSCMSHPSRCHGRRAASSCQRASDHRRHRCSSM